MKVFIYCTKAKPYLGKIFYKEDAEQFNNGNTYLLDNDKQMLTVASKLNSKIIAVFELNKVDKIINNSSNFKIDNDIAKTNLIARRSCLDFTEMKNYLKEKNGYAWHIENLEIIEPLELDEFYTFRKGYENQLHMHEKTLTKAPQSYRYAYYKGERVIILSVKAKWVEKILNSKKTIVVRKTAPKEMLNNVRN